MIPNSPESATLYDENSLLSTRPDSLENMLFDSSKKITMIDDTDTYCVMNELDCFGHEENRNLQISIEDMYQKVDHIDEIGVVEFDASRLMKTFADEPKLTEPRYPFELDNLQAFMSGDANLNSASRSYPKCLGGAASTAIGAPMMAAGQYYTANTNNSHTIAGGQLTTIGHKTMQSTNKQYTSIDGGQYLSTKALIGASVTALDALNGGPRRYSTLTTPTGYLQDEFIGNDFDMSFDLNTYDMDEAASSSSGSHLAFSCTDPNILSDIPSRYLTTFNNIQNESM